MTGDIQNIYLESLIFQGMRRDANVVLQKLIKTMSEKGSDSGEMTIKLKLEYVPEFVSDGKNGSRRAVKPKFQHTISSKMEVKDSKNGEEYDDLREIVYDADQDRYVLRPIKGSEQMNLFEYMGDQQETDEKKNEDTGSDPKYINGPVVPQLPPPSEGQKEDPTHDYIDADYTEVEADDLGDSNKIEQDVSAGEKTDSEMSSEETSSPLFDPAEAESPSEYDDYEYDDEEELIDDEMEVAWQ